MTKATTEIWDQPGEATVYRQETRSLGGVDFTLTRRSLSYPEEVRFMAEAKDEKTKLIDWMEFLALAVEATVKYSEFGLTADRVRTSLPDRPEMAWFFIKWICGNTLQNAKPDAWEDLRKKHGP